MLLLNLYQVPDDEADEVRALLTKHAIEFYETRPSRWGVSHGGIWIADDASAVDARRLMDNYQEQRRVRAREAYEEARRNGVVGNWGTLLRQPWRLLLLLLGVAFALALILIPVLSLRF